MGMAMSMDLLAASGVGKACNKLGKQKALKHAGRAKALCDKWKALVSG